MEILTVIRSISYHLAQFCFSSAKYYMANTVRKEAHSTVKPLETGLPFFTGLLSMLKMTCGPKSTIQNT